MIYSYLRVSSDRQDVAAQRGAVEEYSKANNLPVDIWREIEISSRKSMVS
jgi:DNA invertase Pin-like site-specific DNA recombinase